jgi:tetratricopeptide (TPR) repeat protein
LNFVDLGRPLESFDRLLASAPDHRDALGNRANALLKLNRVAEALAAYERALELAPKNAPLLPIAPRPCAGSIVRMKR